MDLSAMEKMRELGEGGVFQMRRFAREESDCERK